MNHYLCRFYERKGFKIYVLMKVDVVPLIIVISDLLGKLTVLSEATCMDRNQIIAVFHTVVCYVTCEEELDKGCCDWFTQG